LSQGQIRPGLHLETAGSARETTHKKEEDEREGAAKAKVRRGDFTIEQRYHVRKEANGVVTNQRENQVLS